MFRLALARRAQLLDFSTSMPRAIPARHFARRPDVEDRLKFESRSRRRMETMMQFASYNTEFEKFAPKNQADFIKKMRQFETILENYIEAHSDDNIIHRDENGAPLRGADVGDDGCGPFREQLAEVREFLRDA